MLSNLNYLYGAQLSAFWAGMKIRIFFRVMFCYVLCQKIFSLLCYVLLCENRKFSCYVMLCVMTWIFSLYKELILGKQRKMRFRIRKKWFSPSNLDTVIAQCDAECLEARNRLSMTSVKRKRRKLSAKVTRRAYDFIRRNKSLLCSVMCYVQKFSLLLCSVMCYA